MNQARPDFASPLPGREDVATQQTARFVMPQSRPVSAPEPSRRTAGIALLGLTALAAFFRLWHSTAQSLRLDEGFSIRWAAYPLQPVVRGSHVVVPSLFQIVGSDVHPPGYFLLLHFWMLAFGTSVAVIRLPSEIAGILAIPALYLLAHSLYSRSVGLYAALLGALSPFWIWHAQEARMYPFLLLFTILSTYGLVIALRNGKSWGWLVYGVASVLAIYSQYYAFLILFAQAIFVVSHLRHFSRRQLATWLGVSLLVAVTFVPWGLVFLANYRGASNPDLTSLNLYTPLILLSNFLFGYLLTPVTSRVIAAWPLLVPLSLALGSFAGTTNRRASLLWLLFLVPIAVAFLVSLVLFPFLSVRYLVVSVPALFILIAVALDRARGHLLRLVIVLAIAMVSVVSWHVEETSAANPSAQDYRGTVQYIEQHARPGDIVALDSFYNQDAFSYYSHINLPVYDLPFAASSTTPKRVTLGRLVPYINQMTTGRRRLWVIYYLETNYDPANLVRQYLAYHTQSHSVIYGGPYQRNQARFPASYRNVQLVRYGLIPVKVPTLSIRPRTEQQLRALTPLSPTLRRPFAPAFGAPGARAPMIGRLLAPPPPNNVWRFAPLSGPISSHLDIFNPYPASASASVTVSTVPGDVHQVTIPGRSNLDIRLNDWQASGASLLVRSSRKTIVTRSETAGDKMEFINGSTTTVLAARSSTKSSPTTSVPPPATPATAGSTATGNTWLLPPPKVTTGLALTLANPHGYAVFVSVAPTAVRAVHYVYLAPHQSRSLALQSLGPNYTSALTIHATASLQIARVSTS